MAGGVAVYRYSRRYIARRQRALTFWSDIGVGDKVELTAEYNTASTAQTPRTTTKTAASLVNKVTDIVGASLLADSVNISFAGKVGVGNGTDVIQKQTFAAGETRQVLATINASTAEITVDNWTAGAANRFIVNAATIQKGDVPVGSFAIRSPVIPLKADSMQVLATLTTGEQLNLTFNAQGEIESPFAQGSVNYTTGLITLFFRKEIDLSTVVKSTDAQGSTTNYTLGDVGQYYKGNKIFAKNSKPFGVEPLYAEASSIKYNAVAYTYLSLDKSIIGVDTVRLPPSGRVPAYRKGDLIVVKSEKSIPLTDLTVGTVRSIGKTRLSLIEIVDNLGAKLPYNLYSVDLDAGTFKLLTGFSANGFQAPLKVTYRFQDMAVASDVQITGDINLSKQLTHDFSAADTLVSSALLLGTLQARAYGMFTQAIWQGDFLDHRVGDDTTFKFNTAVAPIEVTNESSIQEQWALLFQSSTGFDFIGKNVGKIASGNINEDFTPLNPVTNKPFLTMRKAGFSGGAVAGNVLRLNTTGANFPVWVCRTVLQSNASQLNHEFSLEFKGNKDRTI